MTPTTDPPDPGTLPVTRYDLTAAAAALGKQLADAVLRILTAQPPTLASLSHRSAELEARMAAAEQHIAHLYAAFHMPPPPPPTPPDDTQPL